MKTPEITQPQFFVGVIQREQERQGVVAAYCPQYLPQTIIDAAMLALDRTASTVTSAMGAPQSVFEISIGGAAYVRPNGDFERYSCGLSYI